MANNESVNPRLGKVGGQAVMEGVMMKAKNGIATAVRKENGHIVVRTGEFHSVREKHKILRIPVLRGIINFVETMIFSFGTITESAEMLGIETDGESKFEKWLDKHFGKSIVSVVSAIGVVLGVALSLALFVWLPGLITDLIEKILPLGVWKALIAGIIRIIIFLVYLLLISLMKDIKRLFMYHGAEHKSIFCYEAGLELTVENVKKQSRFHPRCGTSFIFVIMLISILLGTVVNVVFPAVSSGILSMVVKLFVILPLVVGLGFEYIMYAGKHNNVLTRICSAPGLWMQRITTKEPDDGMMEVAIVSVKSALHDEFPDFVIPYEKDEITEETPKAEETETAEEITEEGKITDDNT